MAKSLFYDAMQRIACPKCGQLAGNYCRMPKGRLAPEPHTERLKALAKLPDYNTDDYRIRSL